MRGRILAALVAALAIAALTAPAAGAQIITDCTVSGGGRIIAASGDPATFGGHATSQGAVMGNEVYIDHGPATPVRFRSLTVNAVVCNFDARTAEIVGTGVVETDLGSELVGFRISVFATRPFAQVSDRYRITLSNGYDSGEQPVLHGNITIHGP
jgi:hypothetical protein